MASTKEQWFARLKSFVPSWFFESEKFQVAELWALARLLSESEEEVDRVVSQTFIGQASGSYLDLLGFERNVARLPGELDPQYRFRITSKSLVNNSNKPSLREIVNALLIKGKASMKEDWEGSVYCDRLNFFDRAEVVVEPIHNAFTIVVDKQLADPFSFLDSEYFADSEDFVGTTDSSDYVFQLIIAAVNQNKAFGTRYRIIERTV